jgi:hypothetical protein
VTPAPSLRRVAVVVAIVALLTGCIPIGGRVSTQMVGIEAGAALLR